MTKSRQASWRERDQRCLAAHEFPAVIIELASSRQVDLNKLLRGTGIFWEDYLSGELYLKPDQCLQLIRNLRRLMPERDTAFQLGHRLYPNNFGAALTALWQANDLAEVIDSFLRYQGLLSPLLAVRKSTDADHIYLHWQDSICQTEHSTFLLEMMMTAVTSLCSHLCIEAPAWEYLIPGQIEAPEQYQVNFGHRVFNNRHLAAMRLPRAQLSTTCRFANSSGATIARNQCDKRLHNVPTMGFVAFIDQQIREQLPTPVSLETLAEQLAMSPATLKRKLKKHDSSFQQRYDSVRKELTIEWLMRRQLSVDEIARRLQFHDSRNLRRAFKRWTGVLPSAIQPLNSAHPYC